MIRRCFVLPLLIAVVPACSKAASVTTSESAPGSPSASATAANQGNGGNAGPCANRWYPVSEGDSWTYDDVVTGLAKTSYTQTIDTVTPTGFTASSRFTGVSTHSQWSCTPLGITALDFGGGPSATLTGSSANASFKTTKTTGVTYPATIAPGDSWKQSFDITGTVGTGAAKGQASGTVSTSSKAIGTTHVTVPAGSFDALEIDETTDFSMTVTASGIKVPIHAVFQVKVFLAQGVGMVMEVTKGSFGGTAINGTTSLTKYSV